MSELLPHLIDDPTLAAIREADQELVRHIADLQHQIDIARGKREAFADLTERLAKKSKLPRRRIEKPAAAPSSAAEPATRDQTVAERDASATRPSVFAPTPATEPDPPEAA